MNRIACYRAALLALAAGTGCVGVPGSSPALPTLPPWSKSHPRATDNPPAGSVAAQAPPPTGVIPAGGPAAAPPVPGPANPAPVPGPPNALPQPRPVAPGDPNAFPFNPPADPHTRTTPTVTGGRWNLGPGEVPADRVADLSRHLEAALGQNKELVGRIRELEALGLGREQALAEAVREVEAATAEVARTRATLQALRTEILDLRKRLQRTEEEDVELFAGVIRALDKLLPPPRREP